MEYAKCLVELDEILNYLSADNLEKIPLEIRNSIKERKDKEYIWKYDENKELKEQNLDRKTIAMLSYLNMNYLLNEEQKELMKKIHELNEQKLEKEKQRKYSLNNLFKKATKQSNVALIDLKENKWYEMIFRLLKNLFNRK